MHFPCTDTVDTQVNIKVNNENTFSSTILSDPDSDCNTQFMFQVQVSVFKSTFCSAIMFDPDSDRVTLVHYPGTGTVDTHVHKSKLKIHPPQQSRLIQTLIVIHNVCYRFR